MMNLRINLDLLYSLCYNDLDISIHRTEGEEHSMQLNKKWLIVLAVALVLILVALVCVCCAMQEKTPDNPQPSSTTTVPTTQTTAPTETTVPPTTQAPVLLDPENYNPFTGEVLAEPITARPFLISINNSRSAMPLCGLNDVDIVFEMLVNGRSTRCLALVTNVNAVERIGAIRSLRFNFIDLAQAYNGIVVYASGSQMVLDDMKASGVDNINALGGGNGGAFYREQGRLDAGYAREHTLFTIPSLMSQYAQKRGYSVVTEEYVDYGFRFTQDGTPENGETANTITMSFFTGNKQTTMKYNAETQRYQFHQYGADQIDGNTEEPLTFRNVFTLFAVNEDVGQYHVAQLLGSGDGYYACGGKIVPIKWYHQAETEPFTFTLADGTPLEQGVGNSYVGIIPTGSAFTYS